ncbi:hypothetical protein B0I35DRAFT_126266 [Stachybotrys elegans]|uniref:Uncharacterized protein n=1 Tax=Stachybotrys elegans TaxID=80388 RepID=A0A8K0T430_9HYPO|nr:hypothetical protein B0I35DRAFT_126266 [Stachybotrys elegans]
MHARTLVTSHAHAHSTRLLFLTMERSPLISGLTRASMLYDVCIMCITLSCDCTVGICCTELPLAPKGKVSSPADFWSAKSEPSPLLSSAIRHPPSASPFSLHAIRPRPNNYGVASASNCAPQTSARLLDVFKPCRCNPSDQEESTCICIVVVLSSPPRSPWLLPTLFTRVASRSSSSACVECCQKQSSCSRYVASCQHQAGVPNMSLDSHGHDRLRRSR